MEASEVPVEDREKKIKVQRATKVKNKMPASQQITAEQILREAKERELEKRPVAPQQKISDPEELALFRGKKRKEFEDNIRKNRTAMTNWLRYAGWEEEQGEMTRARSIYERALDVDYQNIQLWLRYADMEMRNKAVNHARNIYDRAVTRLPRANQFWYKYTFMEEMLENIPGCRQVFERWMEWQPPEQAWQTYINFELRYHELERARHIFEQFVLVHPEVKNWIKFAKFEERNAFVNGCRRVYERAIEFFGDEELYPELFIAFAKFEERQKEFERARLIFKYALEKLPKDECSAVYQHYASLEKKFGEKSAIEDVISSKRRFQYEEKVAKNPLDYDTWFDLVRLLESDYETNLELGIIHKDGENPADLIRDTYERAVSNYPPTLVKNHWRRYVYLWLNYAAFEELTMKNIERTRDVFKTVLKLIPHKHFTFAKLWLAYAYFEIRCKDVTAARKTLGMAIGLCPKDKIFKGYIELEIELRQFDRVRILYEKFLIYNPESCITWIKYAELETVLHDLDRVRAIYELAVTQPRLDLPELLWKSFIDFEISVEEYDRVRMLYDRLLDRTQHAKVWLSLIKFEASIPPTEKAHVRVRKTYAKANKSLRKLAQSQASFEENDLDATPAPSVGGGSADPQTLREYRVIILEHWLEFEKSLADNDLEIDKVKQLQPQKVKKRRKIVERVPQGAIADTPGHQYSHENVTWQEYIDYVFPDDVSNKPHIKLLALAKQFKLKKAVNEVSGKGENDDEPTSPHMTRLSDLSLAPKSQPSREENVRNGDDEDDDEDEKPVKKPPINDVRTSKWDDEDEEPVSTDPLQDPEVASRLKEEKLRADLLAKMTALKNATLDPEMKNDDERDVDSSSGNSESSASTSEDEEDDDDNQEENVEPPTTQQSREDDKAN